jgi:hypothetical protein
MHVIQSKIQNLQSKIISVCCYAIARQCHLSIKIHRAIEAAALVGVAGGAHGFTLEQERVAVTVDSDFLYVQHIAGSLAFAPQLLARPRPEAGDVFVKGYLQGLAVHVANHEYLTGFMVLDNRTEQASGIVFQLFV